jgi:endonuclease G
MKESLEDARGWQEAKARGRFAKNAAERERNIDALDQPGGLAKVNTPEELAQRLDRVKRYIAGQPLPTTAAEVPSAEVAPRGEPTGAVLEAIIDTPDFVGVRYLEQGVVAGRAVCRIDIRDQGGAVIGYGTGSMVSPRLLLTNHHVLPSADLARTSAAEFNYQDGLDGQALQSKQLPLDPDTFFINDQERDFALVAVAGTDKQLAGFGWNPLIEAQGKAVIGDFATIVQHPGGEKKQIALRDNRIVDQLELFLHYQADTKPGSSGSPVFNDQWEVVALHHASVPTPEHGAGSFLNEGIRASRILQYLDDHATAQQKSLVDQIRTAKPIAVRTETDLPAAAAADGNGQAPLSWTLPLELSIELRHAGVTASVATAQVAASAAAAAPSDLEALVEPFHDDDFSDRHGYDPKFLGVEVPLPKVVDESVVSRLADGSFLLQYDHFSIVMNKDRRLAMFTASNVDASPAHKKPEPGRDYTRRGLTGLGKNDQEKWFVDPRIPASAQLPDRFYTKDRKAFDKGHIVRREDVAWGTTYDELRRANGDTFHVTNCSPQVAAYNRSNQSGLWGLLENLVLTQAAAERYCLFAGPVFTPNDTPFNGLDDAGSVSVPIPKQFWKIVVARKDDKLQTFAFLLDQDLSHVDFEALGGSEALEFMVNEEWRHRMVSIPHLQQLVGAATFPKKLHDSDQIDAPAGQAIRATTGIEAISGET